MVLLVVSSRACLPIFIEIGLYLTDTEQKISWHVFFEMRCLLLCNSSTAQVIDVLLWLTERKPRESLLCPWITSVCICSAFYK